MKLQFGFKATYTLGSVYCQGRIDTAPQMALAKRIYETAEFTIRDNMKGQYAPNSDCEWLLEPTFEDDGDIKLFDSIWVYFTEFGLVDDEDVVTIYDGPTTDDPLLASIFGPMGDIPQPIRSSSGQVLITFSTNEFGEGFGFVGKWKACKLCW